MPVLPRVVAVRLRCAARAAAQRPRNDAVRRRLAVGVPPVRAAMERPVAHPHPTEESRERARRERRPRPGLAPVATATAASAFAAGGKAALGRMEWG